MANPPPPDFNGIREGGGVGGGNGWKRGGQIEWRRKRGAGAGRGGGGGGGKGGGLLVACLSHSTAHPFETEHLGGVCVGGYMFSVQRS